MRPNNGLSLASVAPGVWVRIDAFKSAKSQTACAHAAVRAGDEVFCQAVNGGSVALERSDGWCVTLDADLARQIEVTPVTGRAGGSLLQH